MGPGRVTEKSAPGRQIGQCKSPGAGTAWRVQQSDHAWLEQNECECEGQEMEPRWGRGPTALSLGGHWTLMGLPRVGWGVAGGSGSDDA